MAAGTNLYRRFTVFVAVLFMLNERTFCHDDDDFNVPRPRSSYCPFQEFCRNRCYAKNCLRRWHDPDSDCWCPFGYYNKWVTSGSLCTKCSSKCRTCFGKPDFCTKCQNPKLVPPFCCETARDFRTGCHRSRTPKYQCIQCHNTCASCGLQDDKNSCLACKPGATLVGTPGKCIPNPGFYQDSNTGDNLPCFRACRSCVGPKETDCTSCQGQYKLASTAPSSTCICDTTNGAYLTSFGGCQKCNPKCSRCQGDANNCGTYTNNANCMQEHSCRGWAWVCRCNNGFFENSNLTCSQCHSTCKTCSNQSPNSCLTCKANANLVELQKNQYSCVCKAGFTLNSATGECYQSLNTTCHPTCLTCFGSSSTQCLTCNSSYSTYISSNSSCLCKYGLNSTATNSNSGCARYQQCDSSYIVTRTVVSSQIINQVCRCPSGKGRDISTPLNQYVCKTCACLYGCEENNHRSCLCNSTDFITLYGYGYFYNASSGNCTRCHQSCKTCVGPANTDCLSCSTTTNLDPNRPPGTCVYLPTPPITANCHITCMTCLQTQNISACASCAPGMSLREGRCVCDSPAQFLNLTTGRCQSCSKNCLSCTENNTECVSCKTDMVLNTDNRTCSCPPGTGLSAQTDPTVVASCQICDTGCSRCDPDNRQRCTVCELGRFLTSAGQCVPCDPTCAECTSASKYTCTSCAIGYYFVETHNLDGTISTVCKQNYTCPDSCKEDCEAVGTTIRCKSCNIGYYLSPGSSLCAQCPNSRCATCENGSAQTICSTCAHPSMTLVDGDCLCHSGTVYSEETMSCVECDSNCLECSGNIQNCVTCQTGTTLHSITGAPARCVCGDGKFFDVESLGCFECHTSCKTCSNSTSCSTCKVNSDGVQLELPSSVNSSLCTCPKGYFTGSDSSCQKCHPLCETCGGPQCSTCKFVQISSNVLNSGLTCCCNPRQQFNPESGICESCDTISPENINCAQFKPNSCECMNCNNSNSFISPNGFCTECPALCLSCSSQMSCQTCTNFSLLAPDAFNYITCICPPNVGFNTTTRQCTICPEGTFQSWGLNRATFECSKCAENCEICESRNKCLKYNGTESPVPPNSTNNTTSTPPPPSDSNCTSEDNPGKEAQDPEPIPNTSNTSSPSPSPSVPPQPNTTTGSLPSSPSQPSVLEVKVTPYLDELFISVVNLGPFSSPQTALAAVDKDRLVLLHRDTRATLPVRARSVWNHQLAQTGRLRVVLEVLESVETVPATLSVIQIASTNNRVLSDSSEQSTASAQPFALKSFFVTRNFLFEVWDGAGPALSLLSVLIVLGVAAIRPWCTTLLSKKSSVYLLHASIWIQLSLLLGVLSIFFNGAVDKILLEATHSLITVYSLGMFQNRQSNPDEAYLGKFSALEYSPSIIKLNLTSVLIYIASWLVTVAVCVFKSGWLNKVNMIRHTLTIGFAPILLFAATTSVSNFTLLYTRSPLQQFDFSLSMLVIVLIIFDWLLMCFSHAIHSTERMWNKLAKLTDRDSWELIQIDLDSQNVKQVQSEGTKWTKFMRKFCQHFELIGVCVASCFLALQGNFGNTAGFLMATILLGTLVTLGLQKDHQYQLVKLLHVACLFLFVLIGSILGTSESSSGLGAVQAKSFIAIILFDVAALINLGLFIKRIIPLLRDVPCFARRPKKQLSQISPIARAASSDKLVPAEPPSSNLELPLEHPAPGLQIKNDPESPEQYVPAQPKGEKQEDSLDGSQLMPDSSPNRLQPVIAPVNSQPVPVTSGLNPSADQSALPKLFGKILLPWKQKNPVQTIPSPRPVVVELPNDIVSQDTNQGGEPKTPDKTPLKVVPVEPVDTGLPSINPIRYGKVQLPLKNSRPLLKPQPEKAKVEELPPVKDNPTHWEQPMPANKDKDSEESEPKDKISIRLLPAVNPKNEEEVAPPQRRIIPIPVLLGSPDEKPKAPSEDDAGSTQTRPDEQPGPIRTMPSFDDLADDDEAALFRDPYDGSKPLIPNIPQQANDMDQGEEACVEPNPNKLVTTSNFPEQQDFWLEDSEPEADIPPVKPPPAEDADDWLPYCPEEKEQPQPDGLGDTYLSRQRGRRSRDIPVDDDPHNFYFPDGTTFKKTNNNRQPTHMNRKNFRFPDGEEIARERYPVHPDYNRYYYKRRSPEDIPVVSDSDKFIFRDGSHIPRRHAFQKPHDQDDMYVYFRERDEYRYLRSRHPVCEDIHKVYPPGHVSWYQIPQDGPDYVLPNKQRVPVRYVRDIDMDGDTANINLRDTYGNPVPLYWINWIRKCRRIGEADNQWRDPREYPAMDDEDYYHYDDGMKIKKRYNQQPQHIGDRYVEYDDGELVPLGRYVRLGERLSILRSQTNEAAYKRNQRLNLQDRERMEQEGYRPVASEIDYTYRPREYEEERNPMIKKNMFFGRRVTEQESPRTNPQKLQESEIWVPPRTDRMRVKVEQKKIIEGKLSCDTEREKTQTSEVFENGKPGQRGMKNRYCRHTLTQSPSLRNSSNTKRAF